MGGWEGERWGGKEEGEWAGRLMERGERREAGEDGKGRREEISGGKEKGELAGKEVGGWEGFGKARKKWLEGG